MKNRALSSLGRLFPLLGLILAAACSPTLGENSANLAPALQAASQSTAVPLTVEPIEATQIHTTPKATSMPATNEPSNIDVPSQLQPMVADIIEDIIGRTQIERSAISLTSYQSITWADGSIGCPQPGYSYIQVLIDGYLLYFDAAGQEMRYHSNGVKHFVYCTAPLPKPVDGGKADQ